LDDWIVGAGRANLNGKSNVGKSYVVFGKTNGNAIDLSTIADANNPTGGFVKSNHPSHRR
jgi:Neuraminidase (sialidase)